MNFHIAMLMGAIGWSPMVGGLRDKQTADPRRSHRRRKFKGWQRAETNKGRRRYDH